MKKLLLGLGSIMTVVAPVAAVISCGDDKATPGAQAHTVAITGTALDGIKDGLHASLAIDKTKVKDVVAGDNLSLSTGATSINFEHYTKITFNAATTMTLAAGSATTAINAGDTLVMGTPAAHRRAIASLKVVHMTTENGKAINKDITSTIDATKLTSLKTSVMEKVVEAIEPKPEGENGSGSTDNTGPTAPATPIDLTNGSAAVWHGLFRHGGMNPTLPAAGTKLEVTVKGVKLTYTWAEADNTALDGYKIGRKSQNDVIEYLAGKMKGTNTTVSIDDIKIAFGVVGHHSISTGTQSVTLDLGNSASADGFTNGAISWTKLISKIKGVNGFGLNTTNLTLTIDGHSFTFAFDAGASDNTIKNRLLQELAHEATFTGCFDMATFMG